MTDNPINSVFIDGSNVDKSGERSFFKTRVRLRVASAAEVNDNDYSDQFGIDLGSVSYDRDTLDTTTEDDAGLTTLVDSEGTRFKKQSTVPTPTAVSLGGVFSSDAIANQFVTGLDTDGNLLRAQPAAADLSDGLTGTGAVARANAPTFVDPTLGNALATTLNKVTITAPATGATLTLTDGKTFSVLKTLSLDGTDSTTQTFPSTSQTIVGRTSTDTLINKTIDAASNTLSNLQVSMFATSIADTDGTLAANSDTRFATQKAIKTYVDQIVAANDAMVFKGVIDCSSNPNYPAADRGHTYRVSVAGKIGGASGTNVEIGDLLICLTDSTSSGTQAGVGSSWTIGQANIDGAVVGPASATSGNIATFNGTSGKLIQDGGKALPSGTIVGTSDAQVLTNKTLTAPIIATISNTGTLTLPTSTDTLVGRATSDTLTNKALTAPTITGGTHDALTSFGIRSTGAAFDVKLASSEVLTANRTLTLVMGNAARTLTLGGSPTINGGTHSGTNTGDQTITLTGDVTGSGTGSFATTIGANKVTLAMMATVSTARFLGRTTASTGNVESLTATQATALLNAMVGDSGSGGTKGLVPVPGAGDAAAAKFLRADATWAVPAGGGGGSLTDEDRQNILLERGYQAKSYGAYRRFLNSFVDGYAGTGGINANASTNVDTSFVAASKYVVPTAAAGTDQTNTFTSSTSGGDTVSTSSDQASFEAWRAFDKTTGSWASNSTTTAHIQYQFGSAKTIASYTVKSGNGFATAAPNTWTLKGSNTGSFGGEEVTLDSQSSQSGWTAGGQTRTFTIASPGSYSYYRLGVTAANGDTSILIDEITLLSAGTANNMTLVTTAQTADATVSNARLLLEIDNSASPTLNTDITAQVATKLSTATVTMTIATPGVVTHTAHGLSVGDSVIFTTSGTLPTGITAGTTYFVSTVVGVDSYQVSATRGGSAINTTGSQSGTHTATYYVWTAASLSSVGAGQSGRLVIESVDQAATSGTSFVARIKTLNNKSIPIYVLALTVH